jgi:hypothetical protein
VRAQEQLWQKNFACATQLDHNSSNYALIAGEHVVVVTWACPSGDVLVTVESATDESFRRSVWMPLTTRRRMAQHFPWTGQEAVAEQAFQRHSHGLPDSAMLPWPLIRLSPHP